jgi:predicted acyltransferase
VRIASVDAYRGFVMVLVLAEVFSSCLVSAAVPASGLWRLVCAQQSHAAWAGVSLHDIIQPSFYFLVGVSLVLSTSRQQSLGLTDSAFYRRTMTRSMLLIVLGMALVSAHPRRWQWNFIDTLTQIGLAYPFLTITAHRPRRDWFIVGGVILIGYWFWFAWSPLPPVSFDYAAAAVPSDWLHANALTGFAAHWQKNSNPAAAFDRWFLNVFPQASPHTGYDSGLTTLNFIPSIATMILGLFAGDVLLSARRPAEKMRWFAVGGVLLAAAGWLLDAFGICPLVKAIWTPSWVLFSGGLCFLLLAAFYAVADLRGYAQLMFPLKVVGVNSIVAYCIYHLYPAFAFHSFERLVGSHSFDVLGVPYHPMLYGAVVFTAYWLALYVLYGLRVFVRA